MQQTAELIGEQQTQGDRIAQQRWCNLLCTTATLTTWLMKNDHCLAFFILRTMSCATLKMPWVAALHTAHLLVLALFLQPQGNQRMGMNMASAYGLPGLATAQQSLLAQLSHQVVDHSMLCAPPLQLT